MSAAVFRRLVCRVIQSRHSVKCGLCECSIRPEEDVTQLHVEMENQAALQIMDEQPVSTDVTISIKLKNVPLSAAVFRRFVSMVIQSRHSVKCELLICKIEPEEDVTQLQVEMENQAALQIMDQQPVSTDVTISIELSQSRHFVECGLWECTIEPEEDVTQLHVEIENQAALQIVDQQPVPTDVTISIRLKKVPLSAAVFRRLVCMVIQSRHSVKCVLLECTIRPEEDVTQLQVEMENHAALQIMDQQPVPTDVTISIILKKVSLSAAVFRRLVCMVIQSRHSVECVLLKCTIRPEEDVTQLQVEMENQTALQIMDQQPVSTDVTISINLTKVSLSAAVFKRLVYTVIQSRHSMECGLWECSIEPEEDVTQLQVEMENQAALQIMDQQPVSTDVTISINLIKVSLSAAVFKRLVYTVIQSRHSMECGLWECSIEPEEDVTQLQVEMENQAALQIMDQQPVSTDVTISIKLINVSLSAAVFRRLVCMVIKSRHSMECGLWECSIEPEEDVTQLQVEMENQTALQIMDQQPVSTDVTISIKLIKVSLSAAVFRRFVYRVIQSRHSVKCKLLKCTIRPEEDVTQLQVEMENQTALQIMDQQPVSTDVTISINLTKVSLSAAVFKRLVYTVIQSRHSMECGLWECSIEPEEDVTQLQVEMENQAALQIMDQQPVSTDVTISINLIKVSLSAAVFKRLVYTVIQSRHSMECGLWECSIEPEEDVTQLQVEIENQAALQIMDQQPVSTDVTISIKLINVSLSAAVFRRLVCMVIKSRHSMECGLWECSIEPEEDVTQLQVEMENQTALQIMDQQPVSTDVTIYIKLIKVSLSAAVFRRFVYRVIQSRHSVKCKLLKCTIEPEEDVAQLWVGMENQAALNLGHFENHSGFGWSILFHVNKK
ncbi:hypothetical protein MAR_006659, partial [Mya arenaria]